MKWVKREPVIPYSEYDSVLDKIAKVRGINDIEKFLNPTRDVLHDPSEIKNLEEIAERIVKAIHNDEVIAISADADFDGVASASILYNYIKLFTKKLYIIFDEKSKSHGIEHQLHRIKKGTNLVIVLDSSTNSTDACRFLKKKGIDVVVIDHHEFEKENPFALIANPQMCDYPNKYICGAGLTYKLLQLLEGYFCIERDADYYLDLAAVGLISDMMKMSVLENRYIVQQGLKKINNKGLKMILKALGKEGKPINTTTIAFFVAPLINGAIRMNRTDLPLRLFTCEDEAKCLAIAKEMEDMKQKRRDKENELMTRYEEKIDLADKIVIAVDNEMMTKNYNGLVAQKLAQKYKKPAIVLKHDTEKDMLQGSFRSYAGFKMKEFLGSIGFQGMGHEEAGGLSFEYARLEELKQKIEDNIKPDLFEPEIVYDLEFDSVEDITYDVVEDIMKFDAITGVDCPRIKALVKNMMVIDRKVLGKNKDTVKLSGNGIEAIKFMVHDKWAEEIDVFSNVDLVGNLEINEWTKWSGEMIRNVQILIEDYRESTCESENIFEVSGF